MFLFLFGFVLGVLVGGCLVVVLEMYLRPERRPGYVHRR